MYQPADSLAVNLKQLDAIILAGGQGRRLNRDKTKLELSNGRVLTNLIDLCTDLFRHVILAVDSVERIPNHPPEVSVVADQIPDAGPLGGLFTGLQTSASRMNFVCACDLPFLHRELIQSVARRISGQDVLVPCRGPSIEPLVGFYSRTCCDPILRSIDMGDLRVRSFWPEVNTEIVELGGTFNDRDLEYWLLNVNTRHDLNVAEAVASASGWR